MKTVKLCELKPGSYVNCNGEIISKEQAEKIVAAGYMPKLFTVSDECTQTALHDLSQSLKEGREIPKPYEASDPNALEITYDLKQLP